MGKSVGNAFFSLRQLASTKSGATNCAEPDDMSLFFSFGRKRTSSNAISDAFGAVTSPVTGFTVDLVLVVAMSTHFQLLVAIVAVKASFVEHLVGGGTLLRGVNGLFTSNALLTSTKRGCFA